MSKERKLIEVVKDISNYCASKSFCMDCVFYLKLGDFGECLFNEQMPTAWVENLGCSEEEYTTVREGKDE